MTTIIKASAGADFSANGADYFFGNPWPSLGATDADQPYASWFHGTGWPVADGLDLTRNGRHLSALGSFTQNAKNAVPTGRDNCYLCPFTGDELIAAGTNNAATLLAVVDMPSSYTGGYGFIFGQANFDSGFSFSLAALTASMAAGIMRNSPTVSNLLANDGSQGAQNVLMAITFDDATVQVYYRYTGIARKASTASAMPSAPKAQSAPTRLKIGGYYGTASFENNITVVTSAAYARKITGTEFDTIFESVVAGLATHSVTL